MKHLKHLFTALLLLCSTAVAAHDFVAGGIYYIISSSTNKTVAVIYRGTSYNDYYYEYTGSVVIPESVTYNGTTYSVTSIRDEAFRGCTGLTSVVIGNSVTSIGPSAFSGCTGLTSVVIGNSVTSIGYEAFRDCTGLKTVYNCSKLTFSKGSSKNGDVAYYADIVYNAPNGYVFATEDGVNTLIEYIGNDTELVLPADYNGENYVIGADAFKGNKTITSVTIPNSVTSIGNYAFSNCTGLISVVFNAENCTYMGDSDYPVFSGCTALSRVTIGEKVKNIPAYAFNKCYGLAAVHINDLDAWCGIDFASADANPLYYAGNLYLNGKLLTDISISAEVEKVKDYAFYNCNGVTNIDIIDGVKSIGNSAFYGCNDLETLYISNTIESIGNNAFAKCNNILDIKIGSKKAITASENIFSSDAYNNACLYVPNGRKDFYAKTSPWKNFIIREMDFTGIDEVYDEVKGENGEVKTIYDLNGRAVEKPTNGIYIINGKKVVIK